MLVGPDEPYLSTVLERARAWADELFCILDPAATKHEQALVDRWADSYWTGPPSFMLNEGLYRQTAWNLMVAAHGPSSDDWVVVIDADEIIVRPDMVRKAAKEPMFSGKAIGMSIHHIWDGPYYRTDGRFAVTVEPLMFPFRPQATFVSEYRYPTYVLALPPINDALSEVAHLGYFTNDDRMRKAKRDKLRGRSTTDIHTEPVLRPWNKGGLPK